MAKPFTPEQISQILEEFFKVVGTRQYIGARYVPIFGRKGEESIEWDNSAPYEPLTIVLYQGNSYTSRQYVPVGVEITNQEFWAITGNYNAQVELYRQEVRNLLPYDETPTEDSTKAVTSDGIKKAIDTAVSVETTRAKEAEQVNATAISDETTRAKATEQTNADAIASETTRATNAEKANADAINAISKQYVKSYNTLNELINDTTLEKDMVVHINRNANDNNSGSSWYVISDTGNLALKNELYAKYIDTATLDIYGNPSIDSDMEPLYTPRGLNIHKTTYGQCANATGHSIICNTINQKPQIYDGSTSNLSIYSHNLKGGEGCCNFNEIHTITPNEYSDVIYFSTGCTNPSSNILEPNSVIYTSGNYFGIVEKSTTDNITLVDGWYLNGVKGTPSNSESLFIGGTYKAYGTNTLIYVTDDNAGCGAEISLLNTSSNNDVSGVIVNDLNSSSQSNNAFKASHTPSGQGFKNGFNSSGNGYGFYSNDSTNGGIFSDIKDKLGFISNKTNNTDVFLESKVNGVTLFQQFANGAVKGLKRKDDVDNYTIDFKSSQVQIYNATGTTKTVTINPANMNLLDIDIYSLKETVKLVGCNFFVENETNVVTEYTFGTSTTYSHCRLHFIANNAFVIK